MTVTYAAPSTRQPGLRPPRSLIVGSLVPALNPASLDRSGTRALGTVTVTATAPPAIPDVIAAGRAKGVIAGVKQSRPVRKPSRLATAARIDTVTLQPAALDRSATRALGALKVSPTTGPAGLTHTRALGTTIVGAQLAPAGLAHTRSQGAPTVSPQVAPTGLAHTRTVGDPTVTVPATEAPPTPVIAPGRTSTVIRGTQVTRTAPAPGVSLVIAGLVPALNPPSLDRAGTRALGNPTLGAVTPEVIPDVWAAGKTHGVIRAPQRPTPILKGVQLPSAAIVAFPDPGTFVNPASLDRSSTRAQGALKVNPQVKPAGQTHTRTLGGPATSPQAKPAGLVHARALGTPTAGQGARRALGQNLVVTVAWIPRLTGLDRTTRALGTPTARGRLTVTLTALDHTRTQGTPTLSGRALPAGLAHTRAQGSPSVNPKTISPASISHTRGQGAPAVTVVWIARPASLTHTTRAQGAPTARGHQDIGPASLNHTRAQGTPVLSGRTLPAGIVHTRTLGTIEVNLRTLTPASLDRA